MLLLELLYSSPPGDSLLVAPNCCTRSSTTSIHQCHSATLLTLRRSASPAAPAPHHERFVSAKGSDIPSPLSVADFGMLEQFLLQGLLQLLLHDSDSRSIHCVRSNLKSTAVRVRKEEAQLRINNAERDRAPTKAKAGAPSPNRQHVNRHHASEGVASTLPLCPALFRSPFYTVTVSNWESQGIEGGLAGTPLN